MKTVGAVLARVRAALFRRDIYLNSPHSRSRLFVPIIFLLVLVSIAGVGLAINHQRRSPAWYEHQLEEASYDFSQARQLVDVHPTRARQLVRTAQSIVGGLQQSQIRDGRLSQLSSDLATFLPAILGEYHVKPQPVLDLQLVRDGFVPKEVAFAGDRIVTLDSQQKLLVLFNFDGKNVRLLGGDLPAAQLVTISDRGNIFVVDGQRLAEVTAQSTRTLGLSGGQWRRPLFVGTYAGNLYVVDGGTSQVWRYGSSDDHFGVGQEWFKDKQDLTSARSAAVDGALWLLEDEGTIHKFLQGRREAFTIRNLEQPLSQPSSLVTQPGFNNIYIADDSHNRVVVLDKKGVYQSQYIWDSVPGDFHGIAVSEQQKKLLLFVGSRVYVIELR